MACEPEPERVSTPRLPLLPVPPMQSPERSGMLTPPLHTFASVPFCWEEEPGRPWPCTALTNVSNPSEFVNKCLGLPPRLLIQSKITNLPISTTVLKGPSSSFRMAGKNCYGSFSLERGQVSDMLLSKGTGFGDRGWKASNGKKEPNGGSYVFPYLLDRHREVSDRYGGNGFIVDDDQRTEVFKTSASVRSITRAKSHLWTTICAGLKQVVPWTTNKLKKDGNGRSY